ncbi:MAG: DUF882 domain-containing protein [Alphaproteobacteria bacterium]|nr:DUF882 domain-containing protein [Alphaproteobacteria bacterium]
MRVSRRSLLRLGAGAAASALTMGLPALAAPALVGRKVLNIRTLSFDCPYSGEKLHAATYWAEGKYIPGALAEISRVLRDEETDEIHAMDPKVLDVLHRVGTTLNTDCRFEIVCGYRSAQTNAALHSMDSLVAVNSLHMKGKAIDLSLPGRALHDVRATALALKMGGVGYYPDRGFVHLDSGRVRQWVGLG